MTNAAFKHSWTIPEPGQTIAGKYLVNGFCGRGGVAVVLSAMHAGLAQRVAIKMLLPEKGAGRAILGRGRAGARSRFLRHRLCAAIMRAHRAGARARRAPR
jgi:hypothetical protein